MNRVEALKIWCAVSALDMFLMALPSLKSQLCLITFPVTVEELLVKMIVFFSQFNVEKLKSATGFDQTKILLEAESLQAPTFEVYKYFIACNPTPARAGLNNPDASTPLPLYVNVPARRGSKLVSVSCLAVASKQIPGMLLKVTFGLALTVMFLEMNLLQDKALPE